MKHIKIAVTTTVLACLFATNGLAQAQSDNGFYIGAKHVSLNAEVESAFQDPDPFLEFQGDFEGSLPTLMLQGGYQINPYFAIEARFGLGIGKGGDNAIGPNSRRDITASDANLYDGISGAVSDPTPTPPDPMDPVDPMTPDPMTPDPMTPMRDDSHNYSVTYTAAEIEVEVGSYYGIFGRLGYPGGWFNPYFQFGFGQSKLTGKVTAPGIQSVTATLPADVGAGVGTSSATAKIRGIGDGRGSSFAYGVGINFNFGQTFTANLEYMNYLDEKIFDYDVKLAGFAAGVLYRF